MVSVHVTRPNVCGFKLGRGDKYLKGIKIHITPSFGGEVKPSIACRKILSHVKNYFAVSAKILRRQSSSLPSPSSSYFATR
jgi:hypothetical protein